ncbi:MAG TPA: shikimate kinase, partial [Polyangiaceae bacterium]
MQSFPINNLVLVGYRGTGKSTVARELSRLLSLPVVSLDEELVRRNVCSINDIVAKSGWEHFRDLEQALVAEYASQSNKIIDCGGGVVERAVNIQRLRAAGTVFWLAADTNTIVRRIEGGKDRPALTEGQSFTDEVASVLRRRHPLYSELAHVRIDTNVDPPALVARRIAALWPAANS